VKEIVPIVVCHLRPTYHRDVYDFQVYLGEYDRSKHEVKNMSKDYECFKNKDQVKAYIRGLHVAGAIYQGGAK
jgi:hypothetical protein